MTDPLNLAARLSKFVVPDAEAARRTEERAKREKEAAAWTNGDPMATAPKRHRLASVQTTGPWAERLAWLKCEAGKGILVALIGTRGAGKTQLAVETMRHIADQGFAVRFATCMELLMDFKATYRRDSEKAEKDVLAAYCQPKLLVIDEIARRGETDWENNLLFELINQRYGDMRDTILTCNLKQDELKTAMGPSIVSRMLETGGVIECNWESYRGKK